MQAKSLLPSLQSFIGKSYLILKTCFLLSHFDTLNFRKFLKVVWVVLKHLCKSYERNKENRKRKKKKGKKNMNWTSGSLPAQHRFWPMAHPGSKPNRYPSPLSLLPPTRGPHQSGRTHRSDLLQAWTGKLAGDRFLLAVTSPLKSPSLPA
jgi:hypothetical protein